MKIDIILKKVFCFSQHKSIFLKPNKIFKIEKLICVEIQKSYLQNQGKSKIESLQLLQEHCNSLNKKKEINEKDLKLFSKEMILALKNYSEQKNDKLDIFESLDFLYSLIQTLPTKLWPKTPDLSKLFIELLSNNLINLCEDFKESLSKRSFLINERKIVNVMVNIVEDLLQKEILINPYLDFCNNRIFSKESTLLMLPDLVSKTKIAINSFKAQNKNFDEISSFFLKNKETILKNSYMSSITQTLKFFQNLPSKFSLYEETINFIDKNLDLFTYQDFLIYLEFLITSEKSHPESLVNLKTEIGRKLDEYTIFPSDTKKLMDFIQEHKNNKKIKIFELELYKNLVENKQFLTPQTIQNLFEIQDINVIDKNFIDFLQISYIPSYLKSEDLERIEFYWIVCVLRKIYQIKLLNIPLLLSLEKFLMDDKNDIIKTMDLPSFTLFLFLLSENGFLESALFKKFEEYFLNLDENKFNEKSFKSFIYAFQISVNSPQLFSKTFYKKFFGIFLRKRKTLLKNSTLKEISTFLRLISIIWVSRQEIDFRMLIEEILDLGFVSDLELLKSFEIKKNLITATQFKLLNWKDETISLEDFFKIYQFLLTFKTNSLYDCHKDLFESYFSLADSTDFSSFVKIQSSTLEVDVIEIIKKFKIKHSVQKWIKIYAIDIFIEPNIVVEVLGNRHFSRSQKMAKPKDLLKAFHLKKFGYVYIEIPYFEFSGKFFTDFKWRRKYVFDKLKDHLPDLKEL